MQALIKSTKVRFEHLIHVVGSKEVPQLFFILNQLTWSLIYPQIEKVFLNCSERPKKEGTLPLLDDNKVISIETPLVLSLLMCPSHSLGVCVNLLITG